MENDYHPSGERDNFRISSLDLQSIEVHQLQPSLMTPQKVHLASTLESMELWNSPAFKGTGTHFFPSTQAFSMQLSLPIGILSSNFWIPGKTYKHPFSIVISSTTNNTVSGFFARWTKAGASR
jgi:hypothetical protein